MLKQSWRKVQGVLLDVGIDQLDEGGAVLESRGPSWRFTPLSKETACSTSYESRQNRGRLEAFGGERPRMRGIADAVALAKAEDPSLSSMTSKLARLASVEGHRESADAPGGDDFSGVASC